MIVLTQQTYSKAEVEKFLDEAEKDKLAWIQAKEDENEKLQARIEDRIEWYNSYIKDVSENGLKRYWKVKDELEKEIKDLQTQLEASHPNVADEGRISWWSQKYPEIAKQVRRIKGDNEIVPSDWVDYLVSENTRLKLNSNNN
jgi:uncharacterized protein YicC (UPF0701 family)